MFIKASGTLYIFENDMLKDLLQSVWKLIQKLRWKQNSGEQKTTFSLAFAGLELVLLIQSQNQTYTN